MDCRCVTGFTGDGGDQTVALFLCRHLQAVNRFFIFYLTLATFWWNPIVVYFDFCFITEGDKKEGSVTFMRLMKFLLNFIF